MIQAFNNGTIRVKFSILKDFSSAGNASSGLKKILKSVGIVPDLIRRAAIASFEAEVNVVAHANGGEMDVLISPEKLTVVIRDKGPGIPDIEKAMTPGFSTANDEVRSMGFGAGMGLPNIRSNTDEMRIDTELGIGTVLTFVIFLQGDGRAVT